MNQAEKRIAIIPYDERWPDEFAALAAPLWAALGARALRIDHIGSTAVPGLAAKDSIDIQVTVAALDPAVEAALAPLGYTRRLDVTGDHRPAYATGDEAEWAKLYFRAPPSQRPTHLHVRVAGRANQRYALLFRDYLRHHPTAAGAYALIKQALAERHPTDWDFYYEIKDPVCDLIWQAAEAWAAATGWQPAPQAQQGTL
jgi:GrpB-like predicted nucleotidyltransferase (UPF0157 family)